MSKKRHGFFLPLLFIGMGVGFLLQQQMGGSAFVASMFIGMGLGFLLDSFVVVENREFRAEKVSGSRATISILGLVFIVVGALFFINPELLKELWNYLIAIGFILFGLYLLFRSRERR